MSEVFEYVIKSDGLKRRRIVEDDIDINAAIVNQISAAVSRKTKKVMPMKIIDPENANDASLTVLPGNTTVWSLPLVKLPLKTFYQSKDGTVFPVFDDTTSPQLALEWVIPSNMFVVLAVQLDSRMDCLKQYLVAFDANSRTYKLPLSNLYDDCALCSGIYKGKSANQVEALTNALNQLRNGEWQKDLYQGDAANRRRTRDLFSFKVEEKGFSQIPHPKDWTALCDKVANDFVTSNIINPYKSETVF